MYNTIIFSTIYCSGGGHLHYTQMLWADTEYVGCGVSQYRDGSWYRNYVVCHYGPKGNWLGNPVYEIGEPCSRCPAGYNKCSQGLW